MIIKERLGIRSDGNPVIETSTYIPATPDHPDAVELEGVEGDWVLVAVGNAFNQVNATEVSLAEFTQAQEDIKAVLVAKEVEAEEIRNRVAAELAAKKTAIEGELANLGLSSETIQAILSQVKG